MRNLVFNAEQLCDQRQKRSRMSALLNCGAIRAEWRARSQMLRRLISFAVLLGVFMHAHALARHNGVMLDAHLQRASLVADLVLICHPSGKGTVDPADLPDVPQPTDAQNDCPICSGLAHATALPPPIFVPTYLVFLPAQPLPLPAIRGVEPACAWIPPARGPPSIA
jgi:hypothetical protein